MHEQFVFMQIIKRTAYEFVFVGNQMEPASKAKKLGTRILQTQII